MKMSEADKQQRGARFAAAREAAGISQSELARRLDVSPQAVQQYESGDTTPRGHRLKLLREILGRSIDEIFLGSTPPAPHSIAEPSTPYGMRERPIPVLKWEDAIYGGTDEAAARAIGWRSDLGAGPRAFALPVVGDSMAAGPRPAPSGAVITVDPDTSIDQVVEPNSALVIALVDGDILLRRVSRDGTKLILEANKPGYPMIPLTRNCQIIGVVRRITMEF